MKPQKRSKVSLNKLKILVTTVSRSKADFYMDNIQAFGVNMQFVFYGQGTASLEILQNLGLTDSERAVIFSVISEDNIKPALENLDEKFKTIPGGKGIAFTLPLSSVIGKSIFNFLSNNRSQIRANV